MPWDGSDAVASGTAPPTRLEGDDIFHGTSDDDDVFRSWAQSPADAGEAGSDLEGEHAASWDGSDAVASETSPPTPLEGDEIFHDDDDDSYSRVPASRENPAPPTQTVLSPPAPVLTLQAYTTLIQPFLLCSAAANSAVTAALALGNPAEVRVARSLPRLDPCMQTPTRARALAQAQTRMHVACRGHAQVLVERFAIPMTRQKLECLRPGEWLNSEARALMRYRHRTGRRGVRSGASPCCINFYMHLLMELTVARRCAHLSAIRAVMATCGTASSCNAFASRLHHEHAVLPKADKLLQF